MPEIVGLQEINANLAKIIDKVLPKTCDGDYDVVFRKKPGTLDTERVLTTLPVKSQKIQKLTGAFRTASRVVLQSPIGPLVLVVTHQDGDPDAGAPDTPCQRTCPPVCTDGQVGVRACQTVVAAKLADDAGGERAVRVLMGDFNVTPTARAIRTSSTPDGSTRTSPPATPSATARPASAARVAGSTTPSRP